MLGASALPAAAQNRPTPPAKQAPANTSVDGESDENEDIVVTGRAVPGAVIGDIPPENQLGQRAIASYGVGTISELLAELASQTTSGQGDDGNGPIILVNGRRISGVNEVSDLPTESILRLDILPEEVAIKYGYSSSQKVVNIILRRRFRSRVANLGGGVATAGGGTNADGDFTITRIRDNDRLNIAARVQSSAALLESGRGIVPNAATTSFDLLGNVVAPHGGEIDPGLSQLAGQTVALAGVPSGIAQPSLGDFATLAQQANVTNDTAYRTLSPSKRAYALNAVFAHPLSKTVTSSINLRADYSTSNGLNGLPSGILLVPAGNPYSPFAEQVGVARYFGTTPLVQDNETLALHGGATLNADLSKKWRFSATATYDHDEARTLSDRGYDLAVFDAALAADDPTVSPYGPGAPALLGELMRNRATTVSDSANASLLLNGSLFKMPAGAIQTSLRVSGTTATTSSMTAGTAPAPERSLGRTTGEAMASIDVPLTSKHFLKGLGTLTANFNVTGSELSDFDALTGYGYGLNWTPVKNVTLIAAVSDSERAPALQQLNAPTITTANVRVFDYATGTTALVTRLSGGNPGLRASDQRVFKLGGTAKPFAKVDLTISANYAGTRTRNAVGGFPGASAALEAAFPDRYIRDADGDLIGIDARAVNFARQDRDQLRWGLNFTQILRQTKRPTPPPGFVPRWRRPRPTAVPTADDNAPLPPPEGDGTPPPNGAAAGNQPAGAPGEIVVTGEREQDSNAGATTPRRPRFGGFGGRFGGRGGFGGRGPGGGFGGFGGGGPRGGPGGGAAADNGARFELSVYHTVIFRNTVLIRDGLPEVDLLGGGTLGGTAQPRHRIELNTGVSDNGIGLRLTGQWQSAAEVAGSASSASGTLHFSSLATFNLRGFVNLQQRLPKAKWARGVRLTLAASNLLDTRQRVTDAAGATPLAYQPGYLDPLGRTALLSVRKIF